MSDCIFCAIVRGESPGSLFYPAEQTVETCADLAAVIGLEPAVALARALAVDTPTVVTVPPRLVVALEPGLARCA